MSALDRIKKLLGLAKTSPKQKRYTELARKISTRTRTRIPRELKRQICKKCNALLVPGKNSTYRIKRKTLIVSCTECGAIKRIPLKSTP